MRRLFGVAGASAAHPHVHTFHDALHDEHVFLGFCVAACAALNVGACVASRRRSSGRTFEALSGVTVGLVVLACLVFRATYFPRQVICTCLMLAWGTRLSSFLYVRNLETPISTDVVSARILWAVTCAAPSVLINALQHDRVAFNMGELIGILTACVALLIETLADAQKLSWHRFHATAGRPPKDSTSPPVCGSGLWRVSRHPNLFGEMLFHAGVYGVCAPALPSWVAVFPTLLALQIVFLHGGVVNQEQQRSFLFRFYPAYITYRQETSPLVPMPSALWRALPDALKRFPFMELSLFDQADKELMAEVDALRRSLRATPAVPEEREQEHAARATAFDDTTTADRL
jgi:steroid 5-alpha reductase family enzyme